MRSLSKIGLRTGLLVALAALAPDAAADTSPPAPSDEVRLLEAWRKANPRKPVPRPCRHVDPARSVTADLDPAPGLETALADLRLGVILLGADGGVLATRPLGCGDTRYADDDNHPGVVELRAANAVDPRIASLILRTRDMGHCGSIGQVEILGRRGATLDSLLAVEDEIDLSCGPSPARDFRGTLAVEEPGHVRFELRAVEGARLSSGRVAHYRWGEGRFHHAGGAALARGVILREGLPAPIGRAVDVEALAEAIYVWSLDVVECAVGKLPGPEARSVLVEFQARGGEVERVAAIEDGLRLLDVTPCVLRDAHYWLLGELRPPSGRWRFRYRFEFVGVK